ncbi:MAG: hypothetical protein Q7S96_01725 [bacterium]|nr:hypothetical protein [bacterium]
MTTTLSPAVQSNIERTLQTRAPLFAEFGDGVRVLPTDPRLGFFYLMEFPGPDGAMQASKTEERLSAIRQNKAFPVDGVIPWFLLNELGNGTEGLLLFQGPRLDRCVPLIRCPAAQQTSTMNMLRAHPALATIAMEDVWMNTTVSKEPTPFLVRTERLTTPS